MNHCLGCVMICKVMISVSIIWNLSFSSIFVIVTPIPTVCLHLQRMSHDSPFIFFFSSYCILILHSLLRIMYWCIFWFMFNYIVLFISLCLLIWILNLFFFMMLCYDSYYNYYGFVVDDDIDKLVDCWWWYWQVGLLILRVFFFYLSFWDIWKIEETLSQCFLIYDKKKGKTGCYLNDNDLCFNEFEKS